MTNPLENRLLVLLPARRDTDRISKVLSASDIPCTVCPDLASLCEQIRRGAGAALLTEGAMLADTDHCLEQLLEREPRWSNFPLVVLTQHSLRSRHLSASALLNVTLVEMPVRFLTLRSVIDAALRHRQHQYEIRDMLSDLQRAEQELKSANRDLETRVQERTLKLQETVSELEAFSYSISHDLRSPLRSMQGYAQTLLEEHGQQLGPEGRHFLGKISNGAARLDLLVQDVLAYSRIAKGQIELQNVSLATVVRDVMETYPHIREKATITIPQPLPDVRAHPAYLTQCVSNLLGNAVKFVQPGIHPQVKIWSEPEPGTGNVRVWFEDNGIGIAPEHFKEIFEIFGRINSPSRYDGTGIGLAIVRKAAERMGGSVGVISEVGKGSRFWLSLKSAT